MDDPELIFESSNPQKSHTSALFKQSGMVFLMLSPTNKDQEPERLIPLWKEADHPAAEIEFIWFPEGDAVALSLDGVITAIIPPAGYCKDTGTQQAGFCLPAADQESWQAAPLTADHPLLERAEHAKAFWISAADEDWWPSVQDGTLAIYRNLFGEHELYAELDDGESFPPLAAVSIPTADATWICTIGMGTFAQRIPDSGDDYLRDARRMELVLPLPRQIPMEELTEVLHGVANLMAYPWRSGRCLLPGDNCPFDWRSSNGFNGLFFSNHLSQVMLEKPYKTFDGEPLTLMMGIPLSDQQINEYHSPQVKQLRQELTHNLEVYREQLSKVWQGQYPAAAPGLQVHKIYGKVQESVLSKLSQFDLSSLEL